MSVLVQGFLLQGVGMLLVNSPGGRSEKILGFIMMIYGSVLILKDTFL